MKRMITVMTVAMMAFAMMFSVNAEAGNKFKKKKKPIKIVKRVDKIGFKHKIIFHEYKNRRGQWVMHGSYKEKIKGRVIVKGQFNHGRKDGDWIFRSNTRANRITKIVTFDNGNRIDVQKPIYKKVKKTRRKTFRICHTPRHTSVRVHTPHLYVNLGF